MKRILTAALLSSGILFAAGAAPALADPAGYGRGGDIKRDGGFRDGGPRGGDVRDAGYRDGGYRDGGFRDRGPDRFDGDHRHGWKHRHFRPRYTWERVCERNRWGIKRCTLVRIALPRWY